jgi:hypothetical protein
MAGIPHGNARTTPRVPAELQAANESPLNRPIKGATVKTFQYDDLKSLNAHSRTFVTGDKFSQNLKALQWHTPFQVICHA